MATFAISDIHGRIDELKNLLSYINYSQSDTLIFLGDYIDRGPNSNAVIEALIELSSNKPNVHFLKGNHEEMAIMSKVDSDTRKLWMKCGGEETLKSYPEGIPNHHWSFIYKFKKYIETDDSIFVHAGLEEKIDMDMQTNESLLWTRLSSPIEHVSGKKIYCGHTSQKTGFPSLLGSARCIECYGWLTAIETDSDHVYQVNGIGDLRDFKINDNPHF